MKLFARRSLPTLLLLAAPAMAQPAPRHDFPTTQALASTWRRLSADLSNNHCPETLAALPANWTVRTTSEDYEISTAPLRKFLQTCTRGDVLHAKTWLNAMALQAESFRPDRSSSPSTRARLNRILARREFHHASKSSLWSRWTQAILQWILERLGKILGPVSGESVGYTLFGILLTAAIAVLGWWLWRYFRKGKAPASVATPSMPPALHSFDGWILSAQQAAAAHDYARAIHHAYWAGVVWLQSTGTLPADVTRTPRDLLRSLAAQQPAVRAVQPLANLTRSMERFWYAGMSAAESDFHASLQSLEELGCKPV